MQNRKRKRGFEEPEELAPANQQADQVHEVNDVAMDGKDSKESKDENEIKQPKAKRIKLDDDSLTKIIAALDLFQNSKLIWLISQYVLDDQRQELGTMLQFWAAIGHSIMSPKTDFSTFLTVEQLCDLQTLVQSDTHNRTCKIWNFAAAKKRFKSEPDVLPVDATAKVLLETLQISLGNQYAKELKSKLFGANLKDSWEHFTAAMKEYGAVIAGSGPLAFLVGNDFSSSWQSDIDIYCYATATQQHSRLSLPLLQRNDPLPFETFVLHAGPHAASKEIANQLQYRSLVDKGLVSITEMCCHRQVIQLLSFDINWNLSDWIDRTFYIPFTKNCFVVDDNGTCRLILNNLSSICSRSGTMQPQLQKGKEVAHFLAYPTNADERELKTFDDLYYHVKALHWTRRYFTLTNWVLPNRFVIPLKFGDVTENPSGVDPIFNMPKYDKFKNHISLTLEPDLSSFTDSIAEPTTTDDAIDPFAGLQDGEVEKYATHISDAEKAFQAASITRRSLENLENLLNAFVPRPVVIYKHPDFPTTVFTRNSNGKFARTSAKSDAFPLYRRH